MKWALLLPKLLTVSVAFAAIATGTAILWKSWESLNLMFHAQPHRLTHGRPSDLEAHRSGGHGTESVHSARSDNVAMISLDEVFVNLRSSEESDVHYLGVKLELELFGDDAKAIIEQRNSGVKDTIIQTSREQDFRRLTTLPGKLYFKEVLVSRLNEFLRHPAIRDIHFASFTLQ